MTTPTSELGYDDTKLKQLRLICYVIAAGSMAFCVIAVIVGMQNTDALTPQNDLGSLRIVHLVLAVMAIFTSRLIGEKVLAGKMQPAGQPQQSFFQRYQSSAIIQLAAIEGLVLFGAVIVMMTPASVVAKDPTYYLHLTPIVLLVLRAMQLAPNHDKLQMLARAYQQ